MTVATQLPAILDQVKDALIKYPQYRDEKYRCQAYIIWTNLPKHLQTDEVKEVLKLMSLSLIPKTETVERAWRKIQTDNPGLRGKYYGNPEQTKEVQRALGYQTKMQI